MAAAEFRITADEVNSLIHSYFTDSGMHHSAFALFNEGRLCHSPYASRHIPRGELIELLSKALLYIQVEAHFRGDPPAITCKTPFSLIEPHVCSPDPPSAKAAAAPFPPPPNTTSMPVEALAAPTVVRLQPSASSSSTNSQKRGTSQKQTAPPKEIPAPAPKAAPSAASKPRASAVPAGSAALAADTNNKRKASPVSTAGPQEKRPRRDPDGMVVDSQPEAANSKSTPASSTESQASTSRAGTGTETQAKKVGRTKQRHQGPGDDTTDPRAVLLLPGHKSEVFVCAFNPLHYDTLATGSKDAAVNIWRLPRPPNRVDAFVTSAIAPICLDNLSKAPHADLTSLHWNQDGTLLAIGSYDSILRVVTRSGGMYLSHNLHEGPIFAVRFSKNGRWLLTASLDGTTAVWDVQEKKLFRQHHSHRDCCLDVDWLSDDTFASAGADRRINIMKINSPEPLKTLEGHEDEINQIRANPSGTRLASCSDDTTARIWRVDNISSTAEAIPGLASSSNVVVLEGHSHSVSTITWCPKSPSGTHEIVGTSSFDHTARLWDSVTGQCLHVFSDHKRPVYAIAFSPNGQFFASGSGDGWLYIYSTKTYERKWSWYAGPEKPGVFEIDWQNQDGVNRVALALEGRQVAVIDISKVSALGTAEYQSGLLAMQSVAGEMKPMITSA